MTYLIVGETENSQRKVLDILFNKFYKHSFSEFSKQKDSPDVHILEGKNKNSIGIEEVKDFQTEFFFHPFENGFQTGIIFEAEKLTPEAQNAFLKTLEESTDETIFILCTTNEKNLLPTIVSRSRRIFAKKDASVEQETTEDLDMEKPLVEVFGKIEDISQESDSSINFLKDLELFFKKKMEESIHNNDTLNAKEYRENLRDIHTTRMRILANGNRKLVLENLILKLRK